MTNKVGLLRLGKKLVFVNHGGNGHFPAWRRVVHAHHFSLAAHADSFGQRNFRREGQGEFNGGAVGDGTINVETDTPRTYVSGLCRLLLHAILTKSNCDRKPQGKPPSGTLFRM